ncbi:MAG: hypothetical protein CUN49_19445, partial [Candidatus Thermofonsia Clade 1 bacterium]
ALAWIALNFTYLFTQQPAVHRRLFGAYRSSWVARNAAPFVVINALIFGAARALCRLSGADLALSLLWLSAALTLSLMTCVRLLDAQLRQ